MNSQRELYGYCTGTVEKWSRGREGRKSRYRHRITQQLCPRGSRSPIRTGPFCGSAPYFYSSRTVPVQFPYSTRTVPVVNSHSSRTYRIARRPQVGEQVKSSVFSYMKHIALTVPLQCPYSALTVPLWFLHSALTISMTGRGGPEVPYLAFLECKGTV